MLRRATVVLGASAAEIRLRGESVLKAVAPRVPSECLASSNGRSLPLFELDERDGSKQLVSLDRIDTDLHEALVDFQKVRGFGRAIAAPQMGFLARVIAMNEPTFGKTTLINPVFVAASWERATLWDDCFSFPNELVRVSRHKTVSVQFETITGETQRWENLPWTLSELLQHEMDHLDGILSHDRAERVRAPDRGGLREVAGVCDAAGFVSVVPRSAFKTHRAVLNELVHFPMQIDV